MSLPSPTNPGQTNELSVEDTQAIESIYSFWFGHNIDTWSKSYPMNTKLWFKVDERVDQEIKERFERYFLDATAPNSSLLQRWQATSRGKLILLILLDQFPRNMYRGAAKMFEFDDLGLQLALTIINDPTHRGNYSLPERLFIYLPLVHSEELAQTTKGAELMNELVSEVTQRDLRRRYAANARSAKTHQEVIETFGRYPHRNQLLGRETTVEEEKYLSTARNGFVKSVQTSKPTSAEDSPAAKELATPGSSTLRPLRILVLHSFRQNANSLKRTAKKLFKGLGDIATFYYANAPLPYDPTGEVKEQLLAAFGDGNMPEVSYQRQWWNASKDNKTYHHLNVSLHYIDELFKSEGPFDGIFGFSQGGALGGIICGLQPFGNISLEFVILVSGFPSRAECHEQIMQPKAIKNIPSLHIYGTSDVLVDNDRTLRLAAAFDDAQIVSHAGGHFTPNTWPNAAIRKFLLDQQKRLSAKLDLTASANRPSSQPLTTFVEKIEATIAYHQKHTPPSASSDRKQAKAPITPIGLSKPFESESIESVIENVDSHSLDDVMLLVWCQRTTFHSSEPKDETNADAIPAFFRYWISLYLKKPSEVLSTHLPLVSKYGSWGDVKNLYLAADRIGEKTAAEQTLLGDLKTACVQLIGEQLKRDQRAVLNQPDESANEREEQMAIKKQEWISNCAKEAPRIGSNRHNPGTLMAKVIAKYIQPLTDVANKSEKQLKADKGYAYQNYKRLISSVCQVLEKASPNFVAELVRMRTRRDRAFRYTKEQREQLLNAPPSSYITNPEPEPVVPCSLEDLQPLLDHLILNKPGPGNDNQSIVFTRGAIMTGGRLDLCKQVVGPKGIEPLLTAMKNSAVVNRLLLGNNIVGRPGAEAIAAYIRFNADSNIDTWYIAGNNFDGECMSLICDALATDTKVKALWLKRNPILAAGVAPIAQLLTTNHYLQTLDLLNTGLLDEGCEVLFAALKSNQSLKHLYIDTNGLTVKSGGIIRQYFEQGDNHLESLYMSCNALGDAGTCEIAAGLKHDRRLHRLGLASNCVGADGARALVDALIGHPSLLQLNLGFMKATILLGGLDNVIGDEGAEEMARLIRQNQHIRSIDLTFNGISQRGMMQLRDAVKENRTLTTLKLLQFGQVHNEITKEEINTMIERNKCECGRQVLVSDSNGMATPTKVECLQKGQQLNDAINFPEHVMEIISYYRTH